MERPSFFRHWTELEDEDNSHDKDDAELMAIGAPLAAKLGLTRIGLHHMRVPPGRRTSYLSAPLVAQFSVGANKSVSATGAHIGFGARKTPREPSTSCGTWMFSHGTTGFGVATTISARKYPVGGKEGLNMTRAAHAESGNLPTVSPIHTSPHRIKCRHPAARRNDCVRALH